MMIHPTNQMTFNIRIRGAIVLVLTFLLYGFDIPTGLAQVSTAITPTTGTGDLSTTVRADGNIVQITGGTRPGSGTNLFHSFDQFNIGHGDTAQFLNTTPSFGTDNILSRVTGDNPSSIFGAIDTISYPEANLFLMNPAGIVFGPGATLNVSGSVAFTTADYLRLASADSSHTGIFHSDPIATSLFTSASVAAFGFLGSNPASIAVQEGTLTVEPGQSISLVGGNQGFSANVSVLDGVTVTGSQLLARGGQINIASVASPGEILARTLNYSPNVNGQSFGTLGTTQISQQSNIDTSGESGGAILIRGGRLILDNSTMSANIKATGPNAEPKIGLSGAGINIQVKQDTVIDNGAIIEANAVALFAHKHESSGISITADHITISGGPKILSFVEANPKADIPFAGIRSNIGPNSTAVKSGDISLEASSIDIKDLGQIETRTAGMGSAGHINLKASRNIDINFTNVLSISDNSSVHSGNILINSSHGNVSFTDTTVTSQTGGNNSGNAGRFEITAPHGNILLDGAQVFNFVEGGTGRLGGIQIEANNLDLRNGTAIGGNNSGEQIAENIQITLDSLLTLSGNSAITTEAIGPADAANLIISAGDILISDGSLLFSGTFSSGAGGLIDLSVRSLTIQNGGTISAETSGTASSAIGGSIEVKATDHVTMTENASITASSKGPADAGKIFINAGQLLDVRDSSITTKAEKASGGNIDIRAIDSVRFASSQINASVGADRGTGGNITIDPKVVILQDSQISAQAVEGRGGDITIITPLLSQDLPSRINASSQLGLHGTVTIQSPTSNLSGTVKQLPSKPSDTQALLQNRCAALTGGEQSTFIVAGRDALPAEPGGWLSTPLSMDHLNGHDMEHAAGPMARSMGLPGSPARVAPAGETQVSLRRLTPPGFLVRTFGIDGPTGCRS